MVISKFFHTVIEPKFNTALKFAYLAVYCLRNIRGYSFAYIPPSIEEKYIDSTINQLSVNCLVLGSRRNSEGFKT